MATHVVCTHFVTEDFQLSIAAEEALAMVLYRFTFPMWYP